MKMITFMNGLQLFTQALTAAEKEVFGNHFQKTKRDIIPACGDQEIIAVQDNDPLLESVQSIKKNNQKAGRQVLVG